MKSAVVASLASFGVARSPATGPAPAPSAPTPGGPTPPAVGLLPWREPSSAAHRCGGPIGYLDILCGTHMYCEAFTYAPYMTDFRFRSADACLRAHGPPGKPAPVPAPRSLRWIERGTNPADCGRPLGFITDRNCGTRRYCDALDTVALALTDKQFASTDDCLLAHEEDPFGSEAIPPPKPWLEPADPWALCGINDYVEKECGTARYCWAFDYDREFTDGAFRSQRHCLAMRREPPPGAAPLRTKLGWKQRRTDGSCDKSLFWNVMLCGTRTYCNAFDLYRNVTMGRFWTAADCYNAFEAEPSVAVV